jgi:manganese-dependent inorganic pyrophosphatase
MDNSNKAAAAELDASKKKQKVQFHSDVHRAGAAEALRLASGDNGKKYDNDIVRKRTEVEEQVIAKESDAEHIVKSLPKATDVPKVDLFLPEILKNSIFVGHVVTDLDSVAGAVGAAALYGGTPALASKVNSETQFALDMWKVELPRTIEELLEEDPKADVCLVDHQQTSQMNPIISSDQIVGVIDHHALQSKTIVTDKPIYIDIRPWGSMSTM